MHKKPKLLQTGRREQPYRIRFIQNVRSAPHRHGTVEVLFVLSGEVFISVQDESYQLQAGDILLINQNELHRHICKGICSVLVMNLYMEQFDIPSEEADELFFRCNSAAEQDEDKYQNLRSLIAHIAYHNIAQDDTTLYDNKSFAYTLLKELVGNFRIPARPVTPQPAGRIDVVTQYIREHYREDLRLSQMAEALHLSAPYISSMFSTYLKTTFLDYYNDVRLSHAVQLLLETDDLIEDIAAASGYANAQAFVRAFRSSYACLPSAYRKEHRHTKTEGEEYALLADYLPQEEKWELTPAKPVRQEVGYCSWNDEKGTFQKPYGKLIGLGSAKEVLYKEVQEQLRELQEEIGFEYVKFHGIFSDEMMVVTRSADNKPVFNFLLIDMVFDFLFSIELKPFIELSFMPIELALDRQKMIFNNRYNASMPSHLHEWIELVEAFFHHLIRRYGLERVRALPVTLWNNPDSATDMFGMQKEEAFFDMYKQTFLAVKKICPQILFGSPPVTFMHEESTAWSGRFFRYLQGEGVKPDFFCVQQYNVVWQKGPINIDLHSWQPDHLVSTMDSEFPLLAGFPVSTNPDYMQEAVSAVIRFKEEYGLSSLPVWVTEWNISVSHRNLINDTVFAGCYIIKNVVEHAQNLDALGYWCATDYIEEQSLPSEIFHGGLGLMTVDGIRKPQFLGFQTLNQMRSVLLASGDGYCITRSNSVLTILMYNYEHYNDLFAGNKMFNVSMTNRYTPFHHQERRRFQLEIADLPARDVLESVEFIVNKDYGSAFDLWLKMGAPAGGVLPSLDRYRLKNLKAQATPLVRSFQADIRERTLRYEAVLEPLEFRLVKIILR